MSGRANCHNMAAMEGFFGILEAEFFRLNRFESLDALKAGTKQYIHYQPQMRQAEIERAESYDVQHRAPCGVAETFVKLCGVSSITVP